MLNFWCNKIAFILSYICNYILLKIKYMINSKIFLFFAILISFSSCNNNSNDNKIVKQNSKKVVVHELSDPDKLNPISSQGAGAVYIEHKSSN